MNEVQTDIYAMADIALGEEQEVSTICILLGSKVLPMPVVLGQTLLRLGHDYYERVNAAWNPDNGGYDLFLRRADSLQAMGRAVDADSELLAMVTAIKAE